MTIYQFVNIILIFDMRYRRDIILNTSCFFQKKKPSELRPTAMSTTGSKQPTHPTTTPHTSGQSAVPRQTAKAPSSKPTTASHTGNRMGVAPTPTSPAGGWEDSGWGRRGRGEVTSGHRLTTRLQVRHSLHCSFGYPKTNIYERRSHKRLLPNSLFSILVGLSV